MENPRPQEPYFSSKPDLPNATAAMVLGIVSVLFSLTTVALILLPVAFKTTLFGIGGMICAGVALYMYANAKALQEQEPERYTKISWDRAKLGRVFALIGIVSHFLFFAWFFYIYFVAR